MPVTSSRKTREGLMAHEGRIEGSREGQANPEGRTQKGGLDSRGWKPSLGFKIGIAGLVFFTTILVAAGLTAAQQGDPSAPSATPTASPQPDKDDGGRPRRPRDSFLQELWGASAQTLSIAGTLHGVSTGAGSQETDRAPATTTTLTPTPTVGEGISATPAAFAPDAVPALAPAASTLVAQIESEHGVRIQTEGQNWGADESDQLRNLGAVEDALAALPVSLMDEVRIGTGGVLTLLSNDHGRTMDGWQPYGDRAANFYTNEDQGQAGRHASNQVVLQPGSSKHTVAHEVVHAYQLRDVDPGAFIAALLTNEMESFMQATGWKQLASDDEILATSGSSWDGINDLFVYDGPSLLYTNNFGGTSELYAPNPLEAFAEAAALYYTHESPLPGWEAYWDWFAVNLG